MSDQERESLLAMIEAAKRVGEADIPEEESED